MLFSALMLRLAFLSRVAFLCNACLVLVFLLRYLPFGQPANESDSFVHFLAKNATAGFASLVIIMGLALAFIMNPIVNVLYAVVLVRRQPLRMRVPVWLAIANFLFLIIQLYLVFQ